MIRCNSCGCQFNPDTQPGGLAFSPPVPHQTLVVKYHICTICWYDKLLVLLSNPLKPIEK